MRSSHLARAEQYIELDRWSEAQVALSQALGDDPDDAYLHARLGFVLMMMEQHRQAETEAGRAIALDPELAYGHLIMGLVHLDGKRFVSAMDCAKEVLRLEPFYTGGYFLQASVHYEKREYRQALATITQGMQYDPNDAGLLSIQASTMQMLGMKQGAQSAARTMIENDPSAPAGHTQLGWARLTAGQSRLAEEAFTDALRLDARDEAAREGLLTALRARFLPYRIILAIDVFFQRFPSWVGIAVWVGIPYLLRISLRSGSIPPEALPFIIGLYIIASALVYFSWSAKLYANAVLYLHPLGRLALTKADKTESIFVLVLGLMILGGFLTFFIANSGMGLLIGAAGLVFSAIIGGVSNYVEREDVRLFWAWFVGCLGVLVCGGLTVTHVSGFDFPLNLVDFLTRANRRGTQTAQ